MSSVTSSSEYYDRLRNLCGVCHNKTGASRGSTHKALKSLKFRAYQVKVAQELRPPDAGQRRQNCEWFLGLIHKNVSTLDKTFFTDEAWFHLNGYINSQNTRIWATESPHTLHEYRLTPRKSVFGVLYRVGELRDPDFFNPL